MSSEYDDELFSFEDEVLTAEDPHHTPTWRVLIVDDDKDVHQQFRNRDEEFLFLPFRNQLIYEKHQLLFVSLSFRNW